ncbi:MAG: glucose-6-phosphate isomerase [Acetobacteraceae bacterium]|nr:glucose-6-phosphate isomerase [Acetobacteraceae bacterium]
MPAGRPTLPAVPDDSACRAAFARLAALAARADGRRITPLFAADPERAQRMCFALDDLSLDLSRTAIDDAVWNALFELARAADLDGFRRRLFAGEPVNVTEGRAAMHMALRAPADSGLRAALPGRVDDAAALAAGERERMRAFVEGVHAGRILGATGRRLTCVLHVGIGGSSLGPCVATEALTLAADDAPMQARFLSNVDGHAFEAATHRLDPETTLVLVASKSWTTPETAMNAAALRAWLSGALGEDAVAGHFVALSTNLAAVRAFGVPPERTFGFRDWVGGRHSLWSPAGLVIALAAGWPAFQGLLDGAWAMDQHFRDAPLERNLPVLLALAGVWHVNGMGCATQCVLAYDERLRRLPAHVQQVEMESNGKRVTLAGQAVDHATCPVVFGEPGTSAQHSLMQLVHQGPAVVPVDFILAASPDHAREDAHRVLAANAFAQAAALMSGRSEAAVRAEMAAHGTPPEVIDRVAPHRAFPGERPSAMILFRRLDAFSLGRLLAFYEHKVAVQGCLWGIDSFDQWGVELGKQLASGILPALEGKEAPEAEGDPATRAVVGRFRELREEG